MLKIAIVGAGITGLTTAFRLQQSLPQAEITVLEESSRPGGKIWTDHIQGYRVELGPNGFLDNKPFVMNLCRDLGLHDRLIAGSDAARKNRFLFLNQRLQLLPSSLLRFLLSSVLSIRGKWNLLTEPFRRSRSTDTDESIDAFFRRRLGREAAETLGDAFVTGIFAGDPTLLSVQACLPRLVALEREHGSLLRGQIASARARKQQAQISGSPAPPSGKMWSFPEGLRLLVETLAMRLHRPPVLNAPVRGITHDNGQWQISTEGHPPTRTDVLVLTCPAYQQAALLSSLDSELSQLVGGIPYTRVAVAALGYRTEDVPVKPDGFGFLCRQREKRDLLGTQWCSSIYPERSPQGTVLMRAMCGGWNRPEMVGWDDELLSAAIRQELRAAMKINVPPLFQQIVRWDRAIPQYMLGHLQRVQRIEELSEHHRGLFLTGNAFRGVAMNDCVEQAELTVQRIVRTFAPSV